MRLLNEICQFIRIKNIIMCVIHQLLIYKFLNNDNDNDNDNDKFINMLYCVTCHFFAGIHVFIMNDWFDIETDKINNRNRFLVKYYKEKNVLFYVNLFTIFCCIFTLIFGYLSSNIIFLTSIYGVITPFLYNFVQRKKKLYYCKNFFVSFTLFLVTISPLIVLELFNLNVLHIATLSFLSTFERELIKDIEDFDGDKLTGKYTIPVTLGVQRSKNFVYSIISIISLINFMNLLSSIFFIEKCTHISYLIINLIIITYTFKAKEKKDYSKISSLCKYQMLLGILTLPYL
jgi:4-hydroxybenzoate polyprenyltransferase